jgi:hypothetical protein
MRMNRRSFLAQALGGGGILLGSSLPAVACHHRRRLLAPATEDTVLCARHPNLNPGWGSSFRSLNRVLRFTASASFPPLQSFLEIWMPTQSYDFLVARWTFPNVVPVNFHSHKTELGVFVFVVFSLGQQMQVAGEQGDPYAGGRTVRFGPPNTATVHIVAVG